MEIVSTVRVETVPAEDTIQRAVKELGLTYKYDDGWVRIPGWIQDRLIAQLIHKGSSVELWAHGYPVTVLALARRLEEYGKTVKVEFKNDVHKTTLGEAMKSDGYCP